MGRCSAGRWEAKVRVCRHSKGGSRETPGFAEEGPEREDLRVKAVEPFPSNTTVGEFLQHWLALASQRAPEHMGALQPLCAPHDATLGRFVTISLSASQIRTMEDSPSQREEACTPNRASLSRGASQCAEEAVRQSLLDRNPTSDVTAPRIVRKELHTLSRDQVKQLLSVSEGGRWHALWGLLVTTGLRLGEACALRWSDVDFVRGVATVQRSVQRQKGKACCSLSQRQQGAVEQSDCRKAQWICLRRTGTLSKTSEGAPVNPGVSIASYSLRSPVGLWIRAG